MCSRTEPGFISHVNNDLTAPNVNNGLTAPTDLTPWTAPSPSTLPTVNLFTHPYHRPLSDSSLKLPASFTFK
jgi:hypothetical protein